MTQDGGLDVAGIGGVGGTRAGVPQALWRCSVDVTPDGDLVIDKSQMENRPGFRDRGAFFIPVAV